MILFSVRMLREELQLLQEQGSYVGEIVKAMDKKKVLVKVCLFQIIILSNYLLLREFFVSK
jgi:hypothetical protein